MKKLLFLLLILIPTINFAIDGKNSHNKIYLNTLSVHLFLEKAGVFSKDILTSKEFFTHNFIPFGEGVPEGEIFHNYLIKILFSSDEEVFVSGEVATVKIVNRKDKKIIFKQTISDLYVGPEKAIYKSFLVSGHECEFQILTVSTKEKTISKQLPFHCGE